jgi:hypothetical protein
MLRLVSGLFDGFDRPLKCIVGCASNDPETHE